MKLQLRVEWKQRRLLRRSPHLRKLEARPRELDQVRKLRAQVRCLDLLQHHCFLLWKRKLQRVDWINGKCWTNCHVRTFIDNDRTWINDTVQETTSTSLAGPEMTASGITTTSARGGAVQKLGKQRLRRTTEVYGCVYCNRSDMMICRDCGNLSELPECANNGCLFCDDCWRMGSSLYCGDRLCCCSACPPSLLWTSRCNDCKGLEECGGCYKKFCMLDHGLVDCTKCGERHCPSCLPQCGSSERPAKRPCWASRLFPWLSK